MVHNSKNNKYFQNFNFEFLILISFAFLFSYVPIIHIPFTWIMTFFHEISHGIAALLTGGSIEKIYIHLMGSGLCYTRGGSRFIILQSGYIGAILWGLLIYKMSAEIKPKHTSLIAVALIIMILLSAILYARDLVTWFILVLIAILFISILKFNNTNFLNLALKFIGIYVLLNAIRSPLYLIDSRHYGDGAKLSDLTGIPEIFWIIIWLFLGIISLLYLFKTSHKLKVRK